MIHKQPVKARALVVGCACDEGKHHNCSALERGTYIVPSYWCAKGPPLYHQTNNKHKPVSSRPRHTSLHTPSDLRSPIKTGRGRFPPTSLSWLDPAPRLPSSPPLPRAASSFAISTGATNKQFSCTPALSWPPISGVPSYRRKCRSLLVPKLGSSLR